VKFFIAFGRKHKDKMRRTRTTARRHRHRPGLEALEDRTAPAVFTVNALQGLVTGTVFQDLNDNGAHDANEPGLPGRLVYVDANNNGQLDPGEVTGTTDADGHYELALPPGSYSIRLVPALNETDTVPVGGSYEVTVAAGAATVGRDFGSLLINPAVPLPQAAMPFPAVRTGNEAYVQDLYRKILGRNAGPAELGMWESQLTTGQSVTDDASRAARAAVATQLWDSAEHRALQVESYYRTLLGRESDAAGKAFWVQAMLSGASEADVVQGFLTSAEYQGRHGSDAAFATPLEGGGVYATSAGRSSSDAAFATALYHDLLGRLPDGSGLAYWQRAMEQGLPRGDVALGFLFSTESLTRLVESYYSALLNRPADAQGLAFWLGAVQQHFLDLGQAGIGILASDEVFLALLGGGGGPGGGNPDLFLKTVTPLVGPNVNVSRAPFNQSETMIAVNPANPQNLFAVSNQDREFFNPGKIIFGRYSTDGGTTWHEPTTPLGGSNGPLPPGALDPGVIFDKFGDLFVSYEREPQSAGIAIVMSQDGGQTFKEVQTVTGSTDFPSLAVSPADAGGGQSLWLYYGGNSEIYVLRAKIDGPGKVGPFLGPNGPDPYKVALPENVTSENLGNLAVGPLGQVALTFLNTSLGASRGPDSLYVAAINKDGSAFQKAQKVVTSNVGWFTQVPATVNFRGVSAQPFLAYDNSNGHYRGRLYLSYINSPAAGDPHTSVYVTFSDDDGMTWSSPVPVSTGQTGSAFYPDISVDPVSGLVGVSWYDSRNSSPGGQEAQLFAAFSDTGGQTFSPNIILSKGISNDHRSDPSNSQVGQLTDGSKTVTGLDTAKLFAGWRVIGVKDGVVPDDTNIDTIDSSSSITLDQAATATGKFELQFIATRGGYGDYVRNAFFNRVFYASWADNSNSTGDNPDKTTYLDLYTAQVQFFTNT
jgi:hypothetical protein